MQTGFFKNSIQLNGQAMPPGQMRIVQPKLEINTPGDKYEQEADAMADKVMRMANYDATGHSVSSLIGPSVQRKCAECEEEEKKEKPLMRKAESGGYEMRASSSLISSINSSKDAGSPLSQGTRSFMENAFSADFSKVKVHTDSKASEMSKGINARAFTTGKDIYFKNDEYQPDTNEGKQLLAHELTHVVQQDLTSSKVYRKDDESKNTPTAIQTPLASSGLQQVINDINNLATLIELGTNPQAVIYKAIIKTLIEVLRRTALILQLRHGCFCGPGQICGTPKDTLDEACRIHDIEYELLGVSGLGVAPGHVTMFSKEGLMRTVEADQRLLDSVISAKVVTDPSTLLPPTPDYLIALIALFTARVKIGEIFRIIYTFDPYVGPSSKEVPGGYLVPKKFPKKITLKLPNAKAIHIERYKKMAAEGTLIHSVHYERPDVEQRGKWLTELRFGGAHSIFPETYLHGHKLELPDEVVLIPFWGRNEGHISFEVDHVIELQVSPAGLDDYNDSVYNYELLDKTSNRKSGSQLRDNIEKERENIVNETGDPAWRVYPLKFTDVIADMPSTGERWRVDEIRNGEQLEVFENIHIGSYGSED